MFDWASAAVATAADSATASVAAVARRESGIHPSARIAGQVACQPRKRNAGKTSNRDRGRPVKLFEQHGARQRMRPGRDAEGELQGCLVAQARRKPVVAADDEDRGRPAIITPSPQLVCQGRTVQVVAALVEDDGYSLRRDDVGKCDRFLDHPPADLGRAALAELQQLNGAEADAPADLRGALAVLFGEVPLRAGLQPADRGDQESHRRLVSSPSGRARCLPTSSRDCRRREPPAGTRER
jgi:hypothetical protein